MLIRSFYHVMRFSLNKSSDFMIRCVFFLTNPLTGNLRRLCFCRMLQVCCVSGLKHWRARRRCVLHAGLCGVAGGLSFHCDENKLPHLLPTFSSSFSAAAADQNVSHLLWLSSDHFSLDFNNVGCQTHLQIQMKK